MDNQFGFFSLGNQTHVVPMEMHLENRMKIFSKISLPNSCVVLEGGKQLTRHDTDHEPLFRQESYFHYLFGVKEANW